MRESVEGKFNRWLRKVEGYVADIESKAESELRKGF